MKTLLTVLAVLCVAQLATAAAPAYHITPLMGWAGSTGTCGYGINSSGSVVGGVSDSRGGHACLWDSTGCHDLGDLETSRQHSSAQLINDSGVIAGSSAVSGYSQGFTYTSGSMSVVPGLIEDYSRQTSVRAINRYGVIVGDANTWSAPRLACYWDASGIHDLSTMGVTGTDSSACGINDNGVIVGQFSVPGLGFSHAFKWLNGVMTDLSPGLTNYTLATAVNNTGLIVGTYSSFACYWDASGLHMLDHLAGWKSYPDDINSQGIIVGRAWLTSDVYHACLWDSKGIHDLNSMIDTTGWELREATGVLDDGRIVGTGTLNGQTLAFVMTPVPEPSSLLALLCGAVGFIGLTRRRRTA